MKERYLTISDVSTATTLAKSTLYNYVQNKKIPFIKVYGRILFEDGALQKWIDKKQVREVEKRHDPILKTLENSDTKEREKVLTTVPKAELLTANGKRRT